MDPGAPLEPVEGVCLSTDIQNYVGASAGMQLRDLGALMSEYYETISQLVVRRRGLMMGRAGDSAMCVWAGWPSNPSFEWLVGRRVGRARRSDLRARSNACQTALEIRDTIERFNERHATRADAYRVA